MTGHISQSGEPSHHLDARTLLLWAIGLVLALIGVLGIVAEIATGSSWDNSESTGIIGSAVITIIGGLVCSGAWHRGGRTHPAASTAPAGPGDAVGGRGTTRGRDTTSRDTTSRDTTRRTQLGSSTPSRALSWREIPLLRDPRWPVAVFLALVIGFAIAAVTTYTGSHRSDDTQSRGISVLARVTGVDNDSVCAGGGIGNCHVRSFSASLTLGRPLNGTIVSTVHGQGTFPSAQGQTIRVLIDPHQTSYAELPGNKLDTSSAWIGWVGADVLVILLSVWLLYRVLAVFSHAVPRRSRHRLA